MQETPIKVLLVDDDRSLLRLNAHWLQNAGYVVAPAESAAKALSIIEMSCPDIILTDWHMPGMDGLELCRTVRAMRLPHYVFLIVLTASAETHDMVHGIEIGADDFLTKPITQGELLARMHAATRIVRLEKSLSKRARTDALTGLLTQRAFYEAASKEFERVKRYRVPLSCVMFDLDFFKRINDQYGHTTGDQVLAAVGTMLRGSVRTNDTVARYGGEEFCILLPETRESNAARWAERMRLRLAESPIPVGNGRALSITGSFGVAEWHDDTQSCEDLVDLADQALLCAKHSGRDRVVRQSLLGNAESGDLSATDQSDALFKGVLARHVMAPLVAALCEDDPLAHAAEFFLRSRISSAPVINKNGALCGMLSEKDLMGALVHVNSWDRTIGGVMKPNVISYDEDTPVRVIFDFLCRVSIRRVVIEREGQPVGTISRGSLLRWFRNLVLQRGAISDAELPGPAHCAVDEAHARLAETVHEVARHAARLEACFHDNEDDLIPYIVGGATQLQELANDLLAFSRYAGQQDGRLADVMALPSGAVHRAE